MSAVEQLENGVRVQCASGATITCKALTLKSAKRIMALWDQRFAPKPVVADPDKPTAAELDAIARHALAVARARIQVITLFTELYPELEDHISPGDVERLIPDFFWSATGAAVPDPESPASEPTGTPSSSSTAPSGASSPTG